MASIATWLPLPAQPCPVHHHGLLKKQLKQLSNCKYLNVGRFRSAPKLGKPVPLSSGKRERLLIRPGARQGDSDAQDKGPTLNVEVPGSSVSSKSLSDQPIKPMGDQASPPRIPPPKQRFISVEEQERRRRMEDELKDSRTFVDFLAPRPLRRVYFGSGAVSCTVAFIVSLAKVIANPSLELAEGGVSNVGINLVGAVIFGALFWYDGKQGEKRVEDRKTIRESQIKLGDREVFVNASGETMSRLKPVDDDWIIRRLDRWGQKDLLPQIGPKKGAILQSLVQEKEPYLIVEVGTFTGYSAIKMAQAMPPSCRVVSLELDFKWWLVAKRFLWQAKLGDRVEVRWGDAIQLLPKVQGPIDFLFLDGKPWEYLDYLRAAEPMLAPGAVVVADNAGVFKKSLTPYLDYVRQSPLYESLYIESTLEYRDEVPDGLEVSVYSGKVK